ncbi:hypothetical protein IWW37_001878 [Coemansia sp. RSA 2050]|nr:hypothetical protein IWW37_001878 [Coemansia sp. RSA 2050]KAJ2734764.1 hypothetical protein IW152_002087 [Coemansia sp. BCRC 34962]
MRAIVINSWLEGPSDLKVTDIPVPAAKDGELLVKVDSAGVNFFDTLMVTGKYQVKPPFPFTPGAEFSGTVVKATSDLRFKVGDRVFGSNVTGAYAEFIAVPSIYCFPIPPSLSFEQAAGIFISYPTSYAGLVLRAKVQKGDWVLVHAAAGGVGIAAVQIAKALGARVIAATGSRGKFDICRQQGADHCICYNDSDWTGQVLKLTGRKGADVVYDPVGKVGESLKCVAWNGRIVVVGFAAGAIEKIATNRVLLKNVAITGVYWNGYVHNEPEKISEVWDALFKLVEDGLVRPVVFQPIFHGLDQVKDALRAIARRKTYGKAVVKPSAGPSIPKL